MDREQGSAASEPVQFDPSIDGLSFANFSGGTGPSRIQIDDLTDMFGVEGDVCIGHSGWMHPIPRGANVP